MARRQSEEFEKLEQKLLNARKQLKATKADLSNKVESMDREMTDLLKYFDLAVVETRADMKIINTYSSAEQIFKPAKKMLESGGNLIKVVYKTTRNTKTRSDAGIEDYEELEDLEYTVAKFVDSNREERKIHVIGEKDDGEIFLLIWIIVRRDKLFKSYFRMIPTNEIIRDTKKRYEKEIKDIRRNARDIYELVSEGITILDLDNKILYMNSKANKGYVSNDNKLLESASFEGRLFQEIFVTEEPEEVKARLEQNKKVIMSKRPRSYSKMVGKKEVTYSVNPVFSGKGNVIGLVIISRIVEDEKKNFDEKRLLKTLHSLTEDNKKHIERFKELELNEQWLMKKNTEYQQAIRMFYSFLENAPLPICALEIPSLKIIFVNKELEKLLDVPRQEILDKTDEMAFMGVDERDNDMNTDIMLDSDEIFTIKLGKYKALQKTIFGPEGNAKHIIRIFYDKKRSNGQ